MSAGGVDNSRRREPLTVDIQQSEEHVAKGNCASHVFSRVLARLGRHRCSLGRGWFSAEACVRPGPCGQLVKGTRVVSGRRSELFFALSGVQLSAVLDTDERVRRIQPAVAEYWDCSAKVGERSQRSAPLH